MTQRDRILLRRSKMLAAAFAVGLPACGSTSTPQPCLFCAPPGCGENDASPKDAGADVSDASTDSAADARDGD